MSKEALAWIRGLRQNNLISTWAKFTEDLSERFGSSAFEDKLEELSRLQQTGTVAAYMAQFESLLNEAEGQSEEALITFFVGGLKPEIKNLGTVRTDYKKLSLEFECGEKMIKLQGDGQVTDAIVSNRGLRRMVARKEVAYFCHLSGDVADKTEADLPEIAEVLKKFETTFRDPTELPPSRDTDHQITLIAGAQPVNVNPYRYPHLKKK